MPPADTFWLAFGALVLSAGATRFASSDTHGVILPAAAVPGVSTDLDQLHDDLQYGSIFKQAAAADQLARLAGQPDEWRFTLYDKWWTPDGDLGTDLMKCSGVDPRNDKPQTTVVVKGSSVLVDKLSKCETTLVGITIEAGGRRMAFYVDTHTYKLESSAGPAYTSTANCFGIWDILHYLVIFPIWWLPIQSQPISHAILFGPLCTVIENIITECAHRLQSAILEFANNALSLNFDVRAWVGNLLQSPDIKERTKTPIYVVRTNPLFDTSPIVVRTVRMETCGAVIRDITAPYGVVVDVDLWLPGDPQPDQWADLKIPTYVIRVTDRSRITGPTKTVLDSVIRSVVDLGGSLGDIFKPVIEQAGAMSGVFVAPALGVNFVEPYTILVAPEPDDIGSSAVKEIEIVNHTPKAWELILGGKSPKWLTDFQNALLSYLVDSIMIIIGFTGVPSTILDGFLQDSFFAFALIELYDRRADMGPMHPNITMFQATQSSPYNIEGVFGFLNFAWQTRGYTSAKVLVRAGEHKLNRDIFRGGLTSLVYRNRTLMLTDYIESVEWDYSPDTRDFVYQIGDGKADEPPLAKHQRDITGLQEAFNVITLAPQS